MPPDRMFSGLVEHTKCVSPTCLVHFEINRHSVPALFANRPVNPRAYPDRLVVVVKKQLVCEHARVLERSHDVPGLPAHDWRHCLAVIQRRHMSLETLAPSSDMLSQPVRRSSSAGLAEPSPSWCP